MNFYSATAMLLFMSSVTIGGCVHLPSDRAGIEIDKDLARRVVQYCRSNFGNRIMRIARTPGYVDLRADHGCGYQCLREFMLTGVDFVEAEVSAESASLDLDFVFPREAGKFRYFISIKGDKRCAAFEAIANGAYRSWLRGVVADHQCVAIEKVGEFIADYQVEREFIGDVRGPVFMRSSKVRDRRTQEVVAENVDIEFLFGNLETSTDLFSPSAGVSCKSQYAFEFLRDALKHEKASK